MSISFHAFSMRVLTSISVDEMLMPMYVNVSANFKDLLLRKEMAPFLFFFKNKI